MDGVAAFFATQHQILDADYWQMYRAPLRHHYHGVGAIGIEIGWSNAAALQVATAGEFALMTFGR